MAVTTNTSEPPSPAQVDSVLMSASAVNKRYEEAHHATDKAVKGKGAWYWAHLNPMLVYNADTGIAKVGKLRHSLCEAVFSASNPVEDRL